MGSLTLAIIWTCLVMSSFMQAENTKRFPNPEWKSWLHVDYPVRFEMDPTSLQGGAKFNDLDSGFSFEWLAFGFINDLELVKTVPGYTQENAIEKLKEDDRPIETIIAEDAKQKNIGDYFRAHVLPAGLMKGTFRDMIDSFCGRRRVSSCIF